MTPHPQLLPPCPPKGGSFDNANKPPFRGGGGVKQQEGKTAGDKTSGRQGSSRIKKILINGAKNII